jgi:hypothetical protein
MKSSNIKSIKKVIGGITFASLLCIGVVSITSCNPTPIISLNITTFKINTPTDVAIRTEHEISLLDWKLKDSIEDSFNSQSNSIANVSMCYHNDDDFWSFKITGTKTGTTTINFEYSDSSNTKNIDIQI